MKGSFRKGFFRVLVFMSIFFCLVSAGRAGLGHPPRWVGTNLAFALNLFSFLESPIALVPEISEVFSRQGWEGVSVYLGSATVFPAMEGLRESEKEDDRELGVVTANLWLLPFPFSTDAEGRLDRFCDFMGRLKPDVILLQEVWVRDHLETIKARFKSYFITSTGEFPYNRSGLVILTRKAPVSAMEATFAATRNHNIEEFLARKGFLWITIDVRGAPLQVICTHLYAANDKEEEVEKTRQFLSLKGFLSSLPAPVLAGGDLNIRFEEFLNLNGGFLEFESSTPVPTNRSVTSPKKIDYILGRPGVGQELAIESSVIGEPFFSDHKIVVATFTIRVTGDQK